MVEPMSVVVLSRIAYEVGTDILPPVQDLRDVVAEAVRARAAEEFERQRADENAADARALEEHAAERLASLNAERDLHEQARAEVLHLLAEREAWQDATGLVGASGDPSSVTPENLRQHVGALVSVLQRLLEGAGDADENGWMWVQVQLPEEVVSEARALLREAP